MNTALRLGHNFEVTQLLRDNLGGSQQPGARKAERSEPKHCLWMFLAVVRESTRGMQVLEWSQSEVNVRRSKRSEGSYTIFTIMKSCPLDAKKLIKKYQNRQNVSETFSEHALLYFFKTCF